MKTPSFWREESFASRLLSPIGWLYYGISHLHRSWQKWRSHPKALRAPIICVGNAISGGAGKTPTVRMLSSMLKISGQEPHCISRGYRGKPQKEPVRIDLKNHKAEEVGDEALVLAKTAPSWVFHDRQKAAIAAIQNGATVVLSDDGLQNPQFQKDISLLVMESDYGVGNGQLLPVGPLREPVRKALARSDAVILIGKGSYKPKTNLPIWRAKVTLTNDFAIYENSPVIAFAGIAHPQKFFDSLKSAGVKLKESIAYADHNAYNATELALLQDKAEEEGAILMTTAKDYVKLPEPFQQYCVVVDLKLQLEDPKGFQSWLDDKLTQAAEANEKR
jgi:tetraacyldisaccharide 4'-kinase